MIDDPIEWLVKEFGAEQYHGSPGYCSAQIFDLRLVCVMWKGEQSWSVLGRQTVKPLTRADVARLCELFGVEVKR